MVFIVFPNNEGPMPAPGFSETNAFVAVLEQKSFTRAAKQLGLSPARVSELMRSLEDRLGVRLVERTTRSVAATAAGERLLARLRPVLDDYQAALDSLNDFRAKPARTLRLTVPPPAAEFLLAPIIARFLRTYPEIKLDISVDAALTDIVAERYDAGIRPGERIARDMIALRIGEPMQVVVVAWPIYLAERGTPKTPQDLERHNCIRIRFPSGVNLPWRFGSKERRLEVQGGRIAGNQRHNTRSPRCVGWTRVDAVSAGVFHPDAGRWTRRHRSRRLGPTAIRRLLSLLSKPPSNTPFVEGLHRLPAEPATRQAVKHLPLPPTWSKAPEGQTEATTCRRHPPPSSRLRGFSSASTRSSPSSAAVRAGPRGTGSLTSALMRISSVVLDGPSLGLSPVLVMEIFRCPCPRWDVDAFVVMPRRMAASVSSEHLVGAGLSAST
jgi:DNA-binding transcriptional LysR family regulator